MELNEIILPETKPETEWVRGRALQKMSPMRDHSLIQGEFIARLKPWARGRGEVGPEWRFRIAVPGEARRPLVPDVSYVAAELLRGLTHEEKQAPAFAPTVAIEILSLGDRRADVESKIDVYLGGGSSLVLIVDSRTRTIELHDENGRNVLREDDTLTHVALPDFSLNLREFFASALDNTY
jgi:Uma2 family endonuclease